MRIQINSLLFSSAYRPSSDINEVDVCCYQRILAGRNFKLLTTTLHQSSCQLSIKLFVPKFNKKLISGRGRRTLPPEPRHRCKTLPSRILKFPTNVRLYQRRIATVQCIVTFLLHVINTFTYLLISFLLINMSVLRNNLQTTWWENLCYTQMKAYDVTKRTAELKSNTVRYYLAACLVS